MVYVACQNTTIRNISRLFQPNTQNCNNAHAIVESPAKDLARNLEKFLLDAKKGKTRKFLIVKDGVQIDRLDHFQGRDFRSDHSKARQDGAWGEMYYGTLNGDGTDIRFELSRADGFTNPPGTEIRLKEFLREVAGLKFEPTYVIVDNLAPIKAEDDDLAEDTVTCEENEIPASISNRVSPQITTKTSLSDS